MPNGRALGAFGWAPSLMGQAWPMVEAGALKRGVAARGPRAISTFTVADNRGAGVFFCRPGGGGSARVQYPRYIWGAAPSSGFGRFLRWGAKFLNHRLRARRRRVLLGVALA
jgi:hypothetical protein